MVRRKSEFATKIFIDSENWDDEKEKPVKSTDEVNEELIKIKGEIIN